MHFTENHDFGHSQFWLQALEIKHEKSGPYKGWVVSRLTSRQNNIMQDEISGCF